MASYAHTTNSFIGATSDAYGTLKGTPEAIAAVINNFRMFRLKTASDNRLSQQAIQADIAAEQQRAIAAVNGLVQTATDAKKTIDDNVAEVFAGDLTIPEQTLQEMKLQAAWTRCEKLLNKGMDPKAVIAFYAGAADLTALQALRRELPSVYAMPLRLGGVRAAGGTVSQDIPELLALLDQAEQPFLDPVQARARALSVEVARNFESAILADLNFAQYEFSGQGQAPYLPGWNGQSIDLEGTKVGSIKVSARL